MGSKNILVGFVKIYLNEENIIFPYILGKVGLLVNPSELKARYSVLGK